MKKNKEKYWLMVGLPYIQRFFVVEGIVYFRNQSIFSTDISSSSRIIVVTNRTQALQANEIDLL